MERKVKRAMSSKFGEILGLEKKNFNFHLDAYTDELKTLISNLNDNVIDANAFDRKKILSAKLEKGEEFSPKNQEDLKVFDPNAGIVDENLTKEAQE